MRSHVTPVLTFPVDHANAQRTAAPRCLLACKPSVYIEITRFDRQNKLKGTHVEDPAIDVCLRWKENEHRPPRNELS